MRGSKVGLEYCTIDKNDQRRLNFLRKELRGEEWYKKYSVKIKLEVEGYDIEPIEASYEVLDKFHPDVDSLRNENIVKILKWLKESLQKVNLQEKEFKEFQYDAIQKEIKNHRDRDGRKRRKYEC